MEEVKVNLAEDSYTIVIGDGLLQTVGKHLAERNYSSNVLLITNETVNALHGQAAIATLHDAGYHAEVIEVPDGEEAKTLQQADRIYTKAIEAGLDRRSPIIALGGGVVGDLSGFVAATYQRGVPFIQVPTTLLAQVDSSVGGKVAVNHPLGKNLIGAFYQPDMVITDVSLLTTLPARELKAGLAEVVKYGIICDYKFFCYLEQHCKEILAMDVGCLTHIVKVSCEAKARVVEQDEKESGLRMILNYGHTIGHALENIEHYCGINHGEAVSIGMCAAASLAAELGMLKEADVRRIIALLKAFGLPVSIAKYSNGDILERLSYDKKNIGGNLSWVIPNSIGSVVLCKNVPHEGIQAAVNHLENFMM